MAHGGEHDSRLRRRAPEKTNGMNPLGSETGMSWKLQEMFMEKIEAPGISSQIRQALQSFLIFLHQFSAFSCSRRFPPIRSPFYVKLSWGLTTHRPFGSRNSTPMAKPRPCNGWQYATRAEERKSPVREANVNFSPCSQRRTLTTRAPRALTFSVNVDSEPGTWRCPSMNTGISIRMRFSARWNVNLFLRGMAAAHPHRHAAMRVRFCTLLLPRRCFMA